MTYFIKYLLMDPRFELESSLSQLCSAYDIVCQLGEGSFGVVYLARNNKSEEVALKCINLDKMINFQKNIAFRDYKKTLLEAEYQTMKICKSENVIKCYDLIESQRWRVLVLEFCEGGSLLNKITKEGKIKEEQCIDILAQLMFGFSTLHTNNIIHRDIKTQNILILGDVYKIADFGLAKQVTQLLRSGEGTVLGSLSTMAPEVQAGNMYSCQADLWSLGVIYYQMISGTLPFAGVITEKSITKVNQALLRLNISQDSKDLLKKIFVIDPQKRLKWTELYRMRDRNEGVFRKFEDRQTIMYPHENITQIQSIYAQLESQQNNFPRVPLLIKANALTTLKPKQNVDPYWQRIQKQLRVDNQVMNKLYNNFIKPLFSEQSHNEIEQNTKFSVVQKNKLFANIYLLILLINSRVIFIVNKNKYLEKPYYYNNYSEDEESYHFNEISEDSKHIQKTIVENILAQLGITLNNEKKVEQIQDKYLTHHCKREQHVKKVLEVNNQIVEWLSNWDIQGALKNTVLKIKSQYDHMIS